MRVLTKWVLNGYISKEINQYSQASTDRWIRFYCCIPYGHLQIEPYRVL
ncbi:hypothetical protein M2386_002910 [Erwinia rhapontici]|nr:hypothetical protein [Erwinia rhapontici]